jgi:hypothetical protein
MLRSSDDIQRHEFLGMKECKDAQIAMEKAQDMGRKAQIIAMKARVEEARGKLGPGRASCLLKPAILDMWRTIWVPMHDFCNPSYNP